MKDIKACLPSHSLTFFLAQAEGTKSSVLIFVKNTHSVALGPKTMCFQPTCQKAKALIHLKYSGSVSNLLNLLLRKHTVLARNGQVLKIVYGKADDNAESQTDISQGLLLSIRLHLQPADS